MAMYSASVVDIAVVSAMAVSFGYQRPQLMVHVRYRKTRLSASRVLDQLHSWKSCYPEEILTKYHTMPEGPVLTRTRPFLDDRHVSDDLDQQSPPAD
nr:hypothetical protein [Tanacetum cinerariifolium]